MVAFCDCCEKRPLATCSYASEFVNEFLVYYSHLDEWILSSLPRFVDGVFQSSNSEDNLAPQPSDRNSPWDRIPWGQRTGAVAREHDPHNTLPQHRSWSNLVAPGLHTCPNYQWCNVNTTIDDHWGYWDDFLDLSNDNTTSNETVTGHRGRPRPRMIPTGKQETCRRFELLFYKLSTDSRTFWANVNYF